MENNAYNMPYVDRMFQMLSKKLYVKIYLVFHLLWGILVICMKFTRVGVWTPQSVSEDETTNQLCKHEDVQENHKQHAYFMSKCVVYLFY